ncbi:hypothetical protein ACOJBO_25765 [Rhizobium beringeri]
MSGGEEEVDNEARVNAAYLELMKITNKRELAEAEARGLKIGTEAFRKRAAVGGTWLRRHEKWPVILARIDWIKEHLKGSHPGKLVGRKRKMVAPGLMNWPKLRRVTGNSKLFLNAPMKRI